jgi:hypothetical protein
VGEQLGRERGGGAEAELAAAFDPRLADVWLHVFTSGVDLSDAADYLACFLRMAYLRGYEDALSEAQRGLLFTSLGLAVPDHRTENRRERKERRP